MLFSNCFIAIIPGSGMSSLQASIFMGQIKSKGGTLVSLPQAVQDGRSTSLTHVITGPAANAASICNGAGIKISGLDAAILQGREDNSGSSKEHGAPVCVSQDWIIQALRQGHLPEPDAFLLKDPRIPNPRRAAVPAGLPMIDVVDLLGEGGGGEGEGAGAPTAAGRGSKRHRVEEEVEEGHAGAGAGENGAGEVRAAGPPPKRPATIASMFGRPSPSPGGGAGGGAIPGVWLPRPLPPSLPLSRASGVAILPPWAIHPCDVLSGPGKVGVWWLTSAAGLEGKDMEGARARVMGLPAFARHSGQGHESSSSSSSSADPASALTYSAGCAYGPAASAMTPASLGVCAFASFVPSAGLGAGAGVGVEPRTRIFACDIDGTLLKPSRAGVHFCSSPDDWVPWNGRVYSTLRAAHGAGYKVVLLSNQAGVTKGKTSLAIVTARVAALARAIDIPLQVFLAPCGDDSYRKPRPGMGWLLAAFCNGGVPIDAEGSVYIGDAAGRPKSSTRPRDHSACDATWGLNMGWRVSTPEGVFGGSAVGGDREPLLHARIGPLPGPAPKAPASCLPTTPFIEYIPSLSLAPGALEGVGGPIVECSRGWGTGAGGHVDIPLMPHPDATGPRREVVLLTGPAACGKSTLCRSLFTPQAGYVRCCQDGLGSRDKVMGVAGAAVEGRALPLPPGRAAELSSTGCVLPPTHPHGTCASVVIDATNLETSTRAAWVAWAKARALPCRAVSLTLPKPACMHLNTVRGAWPLGGPDGARDSPSSRRAVPDMVIHSHFKNGVCVDSEAQAEREGFTGYARVRTVPGPFCEPGGACGACALARSLLYAVFD